MKAGNDLLFHFLLATEDGLHASTGHLAAVSGPECTVDLDCWRVHFAGSAAAQSLYISMDAVDDVKGSCLGAYWLNGVDTHAFLHCFFVAKRHKHGKMLLQSGRHFAQMPVAIIREVLNWERLLRWHNDGVVPLAYADWLNDHNLGEREDAVRWKYEEWIPEDTNPVTRRG